MRYAKIARIVGWPLRLALLTLIWLYRGTFGQLASGRCRFHPSCSSYARDAVRNRGALPGGALALWRIARCNPLGGGGIDHPPLPRRGGVWGTPRYDRVTQLPERMV